jgi:uncharacterized membrane protein
LLFGLILVLTYCLTLAVFAVAHTSTGSRVFDGVQGRYFLPVLPLALLLLDNSALRLTKPVDRWLVFGVFVLQCAAIPLFFQTMALR